MIAYLGDPAVKAKYVARMKAHIAADELVQGTGFDNGKGCSIGCTFDEYGHANYPTLLGLPVELAQLNDCIFEGLPKEAAQKFALDFLEAVPVGVDCAPALITTAIARHERSLVRLENNQEPYAAQCRAAIQGVINWLKAGADPSLATAARSAARSAAWSAESAARSAESAAWSAESAARSAAWSARSAAWSAARSARSARSAARSAESAAWSAEYKMEADTLIAHLIALRGAK